MLNVLLPFLYYYILQFGIYWKEVTLLKKIFSIFTALTLVLCCAGLAFSEVTDDQKPTMFAGMVMAIDVNAKTLTLKNDKAGPFTFSFSDNTTLRAADGRKTASEITVGDIAALLYKKVDGKNIATSITVLAPAAKK